MINERWFVRALMDERLIRLFNKNKFNLFRFLPVVIVIWPIWTYFVSRRKYSTELINLLNGYEASFSTLTLILGYFFFSKTVSILEQRLTMAEDKLRECLDNQQKITLQIRPNEWRLSILQVTLIKCIYLLHVSINSLQFSRLLLSFFQKHF